MSGEIRAVREEVRTDIKALDDKLSGEIRAVRGEVRTDLRTLQDRVDHLRFWAMGAVITLVVGFVGIIVVLADR